MCFSLDLADNWNPCVVQIVWGHVARNQAACPHSKVSFSGCLFSNLPLCGQILWIQRFKDHWKQRRNSQRLRGVQTVSCGAWTVVGVDWFVGTASIVNTRVLVGHLRRLGALYCIFHNVRLAEWPVRACMLLHVIVALQFGGPLSVTRVCFIFIKIHRDSIGRWPNCSFLRLGGLFVVSLWGFPNNTPYSLVLLYVCSVSSCFSSLDGTP